MLPKPLRDKIGKISPYSGVADARRQLVAVMLRRVRRLRVQAASVDHGKTARRRMARELAELRLEIRRQWALLPETLGGEGAPWRWHV